MKSLKSLLILLLILPVALTAQNKRKPTKTLVGKVRQIGSEKLYIKPGEFKIDFENKVYDESLYKRNNKYFVIVRGNNGDVKFVKMNNHEINLSKTDYPVEVLRAGLTIPDFVYIEKRDAAVADDVRYKYYLHVSGKVYGPYEGFADIFPTGYICKNKDVYTFMNYEGSFEEVLPKHKPKNLYDNMFDGHPVIGSVNFEVPVETYYDKNYIECDLNGDTMKFKIRNEVVFKKTHNGHYYMIYNDSLMDNSLLIVDGKCHELEGVVKDVDFKFSQNGSHWMASRPYDLMVDGVTVCRSAERIKYFAIKNNGDFAYVVEGEGLGDKMYLGDDVFIEGIKMMWLSIDDEDCFNYIFRTECGYGYGLDKFIINRNEQMQRYYYPSLFDENQVFTVKSDDGKHTFVYSYSLPYILIDGRRVECSSVPHYATWDPVEECFLWNAVEDLNLYLYSIKVKKY